MQVYSFLGARIEDAIYKLKTFFLERTDLVFVEPVDDLVALVGDLLLVVVADLVLELLVLHRALHVEGVALQAVLGADAVALRLVLSLVLVGVTHHTLDVLLRQPTCRGTYKKCGIYVGVLKINTHRDGAWKIHTCPF